MSVQEHRVKCSHCPDAVLAMVGRQGVDHCPACRGVRLDRGKLDRLLERETANTQTTSPSARLAPDVADSDIRWGSPRPSRRRKSWPDDMFD